MNIAFIWYYDKAHDIFDNWRDGLRAALEVIEKEHRVDWFLNKELPPTPGWYDFILVWDDSNTEVPLRLKTVTKLGLCLTTDPTNIENLRQFHAVYCI